MLSLLSGSFLKLCISLGSQHTQHVCIGRYVHVVTLCYHSTYLLQGEARCELFEAKHESHLSNDDGQLSYDPFPYGTDYASRFHIKTMQVRKRGCSWHLALHVQLLSIFSPHFPDKGLWPCKNDQQSGFCFTTTPTHAAQPCVTCNHLGIKSLSCMIQWHAGLSVPLCQ